MKVLIIVGHPRGGSLNHALAASYAEGAREAGAEVRVLPLDEMEFDLHVRHPSPASQDLEADLVAAKEALEAADHVVFCFPTWWGTMPALLKGFLDRILLPGWAFREEVSSPTGYQPLLGGRSAHLITTMDTPALVYRLLYGRPGIRAMKTGTLGFCGFKPVTDTWICRVKKRSHHERVARLEQVRAEGKSVKRQREWFLKRERALAWLKIARLQFYAMTLLAYGLGVAAAVHFRGVSPSLAVFLAGFAGLFLLEFASVLYNEIHDRRTDEVNPNHGAFTGGSRVLVEKALAPTVVRGVARMALVLSALLLVGVVISMSSASGGGPVRILSALGLLGTGFLLGPGYTVPPLRFVYRGLGELVVAYTHSLFMTLGGWVFSGGSVLDPLPWLLSLPMALAIGAAITLAGIPDVEADRSVSKRTLAVRAGPAGAALLALILTALSIGAVPLLSRLQAGLAPLYQPLMAGIIVHAGLQVSLICRYLVQGATCRKINPLLACALSYLLWFSLGPLLVLIARLDVFP